MASSLPSKNKIALAFSRKACLYRKNASIQRTILEKLTVKIKERKINNSPWLDLGCGVGILEEFFNEYQIKKPLCCLDLAFESLKFVKKAVTPVIVIQGDIECLPFKPSKFTVAIMSSVLHWLADHNKSIQGISGLLKTGGYFFFSAFLEGTLNELCVLRKKRGLPTAVEYLSKDSLIACIEKSGLRILEFENFSENKFFLHARDILKNISDIGASAVIGPRLSRAELEALCEEYERTYSTKQGMPVSYNIALGVAQKRS